MYPPEIEWLANITNAKTRRFYKKDVAEFLAFTGLQESAQIRTVARSHVIAWRKDMELRALSSASIRRKLSALSRSLIISVGATRFSGIPSMA
jgi:integrase/recombinase XerD